MAVLMNNAIHATHFVVANVKSHCLKMLKSCLAKRRSLLSLGRPVL